MLCGVRELFAHFTGDKETDPERSSNLLKSTQVLTLVDVREGCRASARLGPAWTLEARRKLLPKSQFKNLLVALSVELRGGNDGGSKGTCSSSWVGFLSALDKGQVTSQFVASIC